MRESALLALCQYWLVKVQITDNIGERASLT